MDAYVEEIRKVENKFSGLEIHHVDCDNNVGADVLSKLGSTRAAVPPGVFVHELHHPSVKVHGQQTTNTEAPATIREILMIEKDWRIQFINFIKEFMLRPHIDAKKHQSCPHYQAKQRFHSRRLQPIQALRLWHPREMCYL